jgi:hypothetical protein
MAVGDTLSGVLEGTGISIPKFSSSGMMFWGASIIGAILVAGLVGFGIYYLLNYFKWNKTVVLFRKVGNRIIPVQTDKGMFERIGSSGDYWLKTQKLKKTLPRPKIEMGTNTFWFYEREDGELINFELDDIDAQMRKAGAYFVDEDMRLQRLGIAKNLKDRLIKETFWQKYGTTIMLVIFCLIVTICLVVLFQKMQGNWDSARQTAVAIEHMASSVEQMSKNIAGSGVKLV